MAVDDAPARAGLSPPIQVVSIPRPTPVGWMGERLLDYEDRFEPGMADRLVLHMALGRRHGEWNCPELLNLAAALGAKPAAIVTTMVRSANHRYARITEKQLWAVTQALLERYGSARPALAAALGISVDALVKAGQQEREDG